MRHGMSCPLKQSWEEVVHPQRGDGRLVEEKYCGEEVRVGRGGLISAGPGGGGPPRRGEECLRPREGEEMFRMGLRG